MKTKQEKEQDSIQKIHRVIGTSTTKNHLLVALKMLDQHKEWHGLRLYSYIASLEEKIDEIINEMKGKG